MASSLSLYRQTSAAMIRNMQRNLERVYVPGSENRFIFEKEKKTEEGKVINASSKVKLAANYPLPCVRLWNNKAMFDCAQLLCVAFLDYDCGLA